VGLPSSPIIPHTNNLAAYFTTLQCEAEYGLDMNPDLRSRIKGALTNKRDAKAVADGLSETDIFQRYLMQTSQATDLISGSVKINALPEKVYAVINHRIAVES
jgi:Gly-Xaa carboxypeptidase